MLETEYTAGENNYDNPGVECGECGQNEGLIYWGGNRADFICVPCRSFVEGVSC